MQRYSISQLPVVRDGELDSLADVIGSLQDNDLLGRVFESRTPCTRTSRPRYSRRWQPSMRTRTLDEVFSTLSGRQNAVVVAQAGKPIGVLTRTDLLEYPGHRRGNSGR